MMRSLLKLSLLSLSIFLSLFLSACLENFPSLTCFYDSDCPEQQLCVASSCVAVCMSDEECRREATCETYQRTGEASPVQVCLASEDPTERDELECQDDQLCRDLFSDPDAYCGIHQRCLRPGESDNGVVDNQGTDPGENEQQNQADSPSYQYLVLEQLSPVHDEPVEGEEHPDEDGGESDEGADAEADLPDEDEPPESPPLPVHVGAVIARSAQGAAQAYGEVLRLDGHDEIYGTLSEAPLILDEELLCLASPDQADYASLGGPGGYIVIRFRTGEGEPASLQASWSLEIIAEGPQCLLGSDHDESPDRPFGEYRALACLSDPEDLEDEENCPLQFAGPLAGPMTLEIASPE